MRVSLIMAAALALPPAAHAQGGSPYPDNTPRKMHITTEKNMFTIIELSNAGQFPDGTALPSVWTTIQVRCFQSNPPIPASYARIEWNTSNSANVIKSWDYSYTNSQGRAHVAVRANPLNPPPHLSLVKVTARWRSNLPPMPIVATQFATVQMLGPQVFGTGDPPAQLPQVFAQLGTRAKPWKYFHSQTLSVMGDTPPFARQAWAVCPKVQWATSAETNKGNADVAFSGAARGVTGYPAKCIHNAGYPIPVEFNLEYIDADYHYRRGRSTMLDHPQVVQYDWRHNRRNWAVHETGHALGLDHCWNDYRSIMRYGAWAFNFHGRETPHMVDLNALFSILP